MLFQVLRTGLRTLGNELQIVRGKLWSVCAELRILRDAPERPDQAPASSRRAPESLEEGPESLEQGPDSLIFGAGSTRVLVATEKSAANVPPQCEATDETGYGVGTTQGCNTATCIGHIAPPLDLLRR